MAQVRCGSGLHRQWLVKAAAAGLWGICRERCAGRIAAKPVGGVGRASPIRWRRVSGADAEPPGWKCEGAAIVAAVAQAGWVGASGGGRRTSQGRALVFL